MPLDVQPLDNLTQVVGQLRELVETKSKESAEYKEKMEKLSIAMDNAEKKQNELVAKISAEKDAAKLAEKALTDKIDQLETKAFRPNGNGEIKVKSESTRSWDRAIRSPEREGTLSEFKKMCLASADEYNAGIDIEKKYLRTDSNIDGGYLCPPEWAKEIAKKKVEITPMRQLARSATVGTKAWEQPIRNTIAEATYEGEAEAVGDTNSQYGLLEITNNRLTASVPVTYEMLNDGHYDIQAEIQNDITIQFAKKEGYMFLKGTGAKQPYGLMNDTTVPTRVSGVAADITFDTIKLVVGDLKVGYDPTFMLNRKTVAYLSTLKNSIGAYLWQEGSTGDGVPSTLAGHPYVRAIDMDDIGANLYPIIFGDFKEGYQIVDRFGMYVIRDEITKANKGMINYIFHLYNGGRVRLSEAFVKLQCHV